MNIKKTFILAAMIASTICGYSNAATQAELKVQAIKEACKVLNTSDDSYKLKSVLVTCNSCAEIKTNSAIKAEIDEIMSTNTVIVPIVGDIFVFAEWFPKTTAKAVDMMSEKYPTLAAVIKSKKIPQNSDKDALKFQFELKNYSHTVNKQKPVGAIQEIINSITASSTYIVRRYLRSQGKSFVSKKIVEKNANGKEVVRFENPAQVYMDELTVILNAPKFNGLAEWFSTLGITDEYMPNVALVEEILGMSEDEFADKKEKVLDGTIEFDTVLQAKFRYMLGTDAYNAFVKTYNEDAK